MKYLSEKITDYIVKAGAISEKSYAVYQYGFQIGLEMLSCFIVCFFIAIYLHMIPEFIVFTMIFILLRTYAGGVHMNNFWSCFLCSVVVQTAVLLISGMYQMESVLAWVFIVLGSILIVKYAPVETLSRELDRDEKCHCKQITAQIIMGILVFAGCCTLGGIHEMVSLIAWTVVVVWLSQYIGAIKFKIEKSKDSQR